MVEVAGFLLGKRRIFKSFNDDVSVETEVEDPGKRVKICGERAWDGLGHQ